MMRFQYLLSLRRVTSSWCIKKICKVAKPKEIFFIKVKTRPRPPKTDRLNTPNVHAKKVTFDSCCCHRRHVVKVKKLCLAFQKRTQLDFSG